MEMKNGLPITQNEGTEKQFLYDINESNAFAEKLLMFIHSSKPMRSISKRSFIKKATDFQIGINNLWSYRSYVQYMSSWVAEQ
ncbi:Fibrous Sheath-Interacting Protein 2 [Manis pentadactyla]|nr:Fibrous Sheath-Interacting Protein 2 [Manis pentadactyla]